MRARVGRRARWSARWKSCAMRRSCPASRSRLLMRLRTGLTVFYIKINSTSGITGISDSQKQERIRADLYCLQPAPQPMGCFEAEEHTPDSYGTINVDYNNYSVPEGLVGSSVLARVYSGHIAIYHQGRRVADHVRLEGKGGWSMQLEHYLGTFLRKRALWTTLRPCVRFRRNLPSSTGSTSVPVGRGSLSGS